jgi:hypothetical protein
MNPNGTIFTDLIEVAIVLAIIGIPALIGWAITRKENL